MNLPPEKAADRVKRLESEGFGKLLPSQISDFERGKAPPSSGTATSEILEEAVGLADKRIRRAIKSPCSAAPRIRQRRIP